MSSRARIDLLAPPFAGHLHPILAIGRALNALAEVRVLSTEAAQARIRMAGLQGEVVLADVDAHLRAITDPPHRVGSNPLRLHAQFDSSLALLEAFAAALRERYSHERPDLLIADFTLPVAGPIARAHGIPWWTSHPSPCVIEAPGGPPAYLGGWLPGRGSLGALRDRSAGLAVRGFKRMIGRLYARRLRALGFECLYRDDGSEAAYSPQRILALSLREFEFARRWPASVDFIGPLLWSPPAVGPPPPAPEDTRPQILISLGTHLGFAKPALIAELERIATAHPQWCLHFSAGRFDGAAPGSTLSSAEPGRLQQHAWVDYPSWIPRMQAVIHHGGAGVLWECLRASVSQAVLPQDYDQFDHAARLQAAGLGLRLRSARGIAEAVNALLARPQPQSAGLLAKALAPGAAEARLRERVHRRLAP
jgi:UDP:flavonoid glycosyltransferase YjiC (YdhE family)